MKIVAVYGTLKKGFGNNRVLGNSKLIGTSVIDGFKMYSVGGFPAIVNDVGSVMVELYRVDDSVLPNLDRLEGYSPGEDDGMYLRRTLDGQELTVRMVDGSVGFMSGSKVSFYLWNSGISGLGLVVAENGIYKW